MAFNGELYAATAAAYDVFHEVGSPTTVTTADNVGNAALRVGVGSRPSPHIAPNIGNMPVSGGASNECHARYNPGTCIDCDMRTMTGAPNPKYVNANFVERQNLTMRMGMRRFTRLTNAFSKKVENHAAAVALHFIHYNFARVHKTLRITPAMAAGISDHVWSYEEIAALVPEPDSKKRVIH